MWGGERPLYLSVKPGGKGECDIRGFEGCPCWDSDSRGLEKPGYTEGGSLSVLVQGRELAALSTRQQRCPWSHRPLPLATRGTTEHPGLTIPPSAIPELINH